MCGVRRCRGHCACTAMLPLPGLSLPGSCPCRPRQGWVWQAPESTGGKHSYSQVFLSSVLLIPNQFLQLPSVISSPPTAAVWGFSCSAWVEVPAPFKSLWKSKGAFSILDERRKDKVWGLFWFGFFFLVLSKCLSEITRRGLEVIHKLISLLTASHASSAWSSRIPAASSSYSRSSLGGR